ncbi:hypothetical protein FVEG_04841 [Fusarium verticillioides 7600]|uniref:Uncharacterized protein n=1 Tax=Gibberella moniliformis (strain M3125 / FGSC 7600) TaxID=334819 RepID=W7M6X1_GIBM7|nr:hypothetical protein FVEG_04841 [Fusarium verticillioides 7600]EWG43305.1 hypothetical protein FVEG_04841 [Fusarium verticillioides 7600]
MSGQITIYSPWYDNERKLKDPKPRLEWDEVSEWEEANLCNKITIFDLPLECPFPLTNRRNACALIENFIDIVSYHRELFPYWNRRAIKYFIWREMFVIRNNDEWKDYRNHPLYKHRDVFWRLAKKQFRDAMGLGTALLFILHGLYTNDWELEFLLKGQQKLIDTYNMCNANMTLWNRDKMLDILFTECEWLKDTLLEAHMKEKKEMDEEWEHRQTKTLEEMEVFIEELPEPMDEDEEEEEEEEEEEDDDDDNAQGNAQNNAQGINQGLEVSDNVVTRADLNQRDGQTFAQELEKENQKIEKDLQEWYAQCYAHGLNESLVQSMAQIRKLNLEDAQWVAGLHAKRLAQRHFQDNNEREARILVQKRFQQRSQRQAQIHDQIRAQRHAQGRPRGRLLRPQDETLGIDRNNTQRIVQYFDRETLQNTIRNLPPGNTEDSVQAFMRGVYQELVQGMARNRAHYVRTQRRAHRTVQRAVRETTKNTAKENGQEGTQKSLQDFTATAPRSQRTDSQAPVKPVSTAVPPLGPHPTLPSRPVDDDEDIYGYSGDEAGNIKKE